MNFSLILSHREPPCGLPGPEILHSRLHIPQYIKALALLEVDGRALDGVGDLISDHTSST